MTHKQLAVEYAALKGLQINPENARRHSTKQISQLASSIEAFGFNVPVLIDSNRQIIAGHGRFLAAKKLNLIKIPTLRITHLTTHQIRAFAIADNRLTENATWDQRILGEQLQILSEAELNFDLEVTGLETAEIDILIENLVLQESRSNPEDELEEEDAIQVVEGGDIWTLGKHRLACLDARSPEAFKKLMRSERAAMVFTDPPYNVPIEGNVSGRGKIKHKNFSMGAGELNQDEFKSFLEASFESMAEFSSESSLHYVFCDWRHVGEFINAGRSVYSELKNLCVWTKTNAGLGSFYRSAHEFILVFQRGKSCRNNIRLGKFGRSRTNVWPYAAPHSFAKSDEGNLRLLHPTVKPVALVADAILDCTSRGDIVLDPFVGSGTTIIAAEKTGRTCYAMDIDPVYVNRAINRWQGFTRQTAVHLVTGQTFSECQENVRHVQAK